MNRAQLFVSTFIAFALTAALAVNAFAKEVGLLACSADGQIVASVLHLDDNALQGHPVEAHINGAFIRAANSLPAVEFREAPGFVAFANQLDEFDKAAILDITQPEVLGSCK